MEMEIEFLPVPTMTMVATAVTHEGPRILLVFKTQQGVQGYFFEPEHAKAFAAEIAQSAMVPGLHIPRGPLNGQ